MTPTEDPEEGFPPVLPPPEDEEPLLATTSTVAVPEDICLPPLSFATASGIVNFPVFLGINIYV